MKNVIPSLLVLAAVLGFCLRSSAVLDRETQLWQAELQQADTLIRSEQWADAQDLLERSYGDWLERQTHLRVLSSHAVLNEADCLFRRVIAFTSVRDPGELLADLSALDRQLEFLALRERLSLSNIF